VTYSLIYTERTNGIFYGNVNRKPVSRAIRECEIGESHLASARDILQQPFLHPECIIHPQSQSS